MARSRHLRKYWEKPTPALQEALNRFGVSRPNNDHYKRD